jgi:hypothetical protein
VAGLMVLALLTGSSSAKPVGEEAVEVPEPLSPEPAPRR